MDSAEHPRRSSRHAQTDACAESTSQHTSSSDHPESDKAEPLADSDVAELHNLAHKLDKKSLNQAWCPFLAKLQEVLDVHQPGSFNICPTPIFWKDSKARAARGALSGFKDLDFEGMMTLKGWIHTDSANGRRFSLAVMTTPKLSPVGMNLEAWSKEPLHLWVLMTAHPPKGKKGKTLVMYDADVDNLAQEQGALGFKRSYAKYIRENKRGREGERVWQNIPVPGGHWKPGEGYCLEYTLKWLLSLVEHHLEVEHENGTLSRSVDGFVEVVQ
ncbi:hypothetical protein C8J57DRAFT_1291310 [Mycena rebaudengoi]|nr:hypothetical protein C8J57DRAFT_1291310 [Mycena rebaudengoi]